MSEIYEVVIVGAGPAGLTAGLYASRARLNVLALEKRLPGGELHNTEQIEDYPGVGRVSGFDLAEAFKRDAEYFGLTIITEDVRSIEKLSDGVFKVVCTENTYLSHTVIATAGGTPVKLGVPGEAEFSGRGVSYCGICDAPFFREQVVAVVGGGDSAVEEACYIARFASKVYLICRSHRLRAAKALQERLFSTPNIEIVWESSVKEISGSTRGVEEIVVKNNGNDIEHIMAVDGIFIFIGFKPNSHLLPLPHLPHDNAGYIHTGVHMDTPVKGLFVAGDLRSQLARQVTTAVGDGTTAAIAAQHYIEALKDLARSCV